jgi:hypothetical protein
MLEDRIIPEYEKTLNSSARTDIHNFQRHDTAIIIQTKWAQTSSLRKELSDKLLTPTRLGRSQGEKLMA